MRSWINIPSDSDFTLHNIPFGIFHAKGIPPRAATRIGNKVIDLYELVLSGLLTVVGLKAEALHQSTLNEFIALGKPVTTALRLRIQELFSEGNTEVTGHPVLEDELLYDIKRVELLMPIKIGDYTDFYSSLHHATNVGKMFRPDNPLLPNWKHLPVAYHGRASSIQLSGTPVKRPKGQTKSPDQEFPVFGPTKMLDFELEMAYVIGKETQIGEPIDITKTEEYIFGFVLFNDWSARDIQSWEYQPLGPFLSKNFLSSISPWIVTLEALKPFRVNGPKQEEKVLSYLQDVGLANFDIQLEVYLKIDNTENRISKTNYSYNYWNCRQQLAHHTISGCNVKVGDVIASGTISGPEKEERGCMLELTWRGKEPLKLSNGLERSFLEDGDIVTFKGFGIKDGIRVGFGEVTGKVLSSD